MFLLASRKERALTINYVEIFVEYLENLRDLLLKTETYENSDSSILTKRLTADMLPLSAQVEIAASFSLRTCCQIEGKEVASFISEEKSFSGLKNQLNNTIEYLRKLDCNKNNINRTISDMAGPAQVSLPGVEFLMRFAFPNFFFHISMAYAIIRAAGIPISKGDFDSFHEYPLGFSYETPNH